MKKIKIRKMFDSLRYKNNKFIYYLHNYTRYYTPRSFIRFRLKKIRELQKSAAAAFIEQRVNYYNKLNPVKPDFSGMVRTGAFRIPKKLAGKPGLSAYFFDTFRYIRYFGNHLYFSYRFGDVTEVPPVPSIVKSRPIAGDNANSVILNLDRARHFVFVKDSKKFENKKNMLVGRGSITQPHRIKFWQMYFNHPMCNLGHVGKINELNAGWVKKFMGINEHLDYKFILCLEGNDVATNLKWVMSSNSVAVMPKPVYETWFMEGTLVPGKHFIEIKNDYSDLQEKLEYYIKNQAEALEIIENAHEYVRQFSYKNIEHAISVMVLDKYFRMTGQEPVYNTEFLPAGNFMSVFLKKVVNLLPDTVRRD